MYGESKTTQIMMAAVCDVTAWAGRYQAAWFLLNRVYCTKSATVRTSRFQASFLPLKIGFLNIISSTT